MLVVLPEDHGDRDDEQDDPAGHAQGAGGEVQQPGQQAAEDQQGHGDGGGRDQHLAQDAALGGLRHLPGCLEERHQRDFGADSDQQQQEGIDNEGGVQRFQFHPGSCLQRVQMRWALAR